MFRRTEFQAAGIPVLVRLSLVVLAIAAVILSNDKPSSSGYRIGTGAIVYNVEARQFIDETKYVEVLDHSLEAGRGIVARQDDQGHVSLLIADAWEAVYEYEIRKGEPVKKWVQPEAEFVCPQGDCALTEHGGFVTNAVGPQVLCEAHAQRLLAWSLISRIWDGRDQYQPASAYQQHLGGAPLDAVAVADRRLVIAVSAEPSRPGKLVLHASDGEEEKTEDLPVRVTHPVGLAFSRDENWLYVADMTPGQLTWRRFKAPAFRESGVVWGMPVAKDAAWPRLHHMVIGRLASHPHSEAVFAAGPDGLYVFRAAGGLLAKYHLDAAVLGLSWGREGELFMTVGRRVARLETAALQRETPFVLPCTPPRKGERGGRDCPPPQ